jgi:transposase-like protein
VAQVRHLIDVCVSRRRDIASARSFFTASPTAHGEPVEVVIHGPPSQTNVIEDLIPAAFHNTEQYQNNRAEEITAAWNPD